LFGLIWFVYLFYNQAHISMSKTHKSETYATSVHVAREVEHALKAEQARRFLADGKKPTVRELAAELLSKAALALV
jgi:hypothetical protein